MRLSYLRRGGESAAAKDRLTRIIQKLKNSQLVRDLPRDVIDEIYLLSDGDKSVFLNGTPAVEDHLISAAKYAPNSLLAQLDGRYSHTSKVSNIISTIGTWKSDGKGNLLEDSFVPNPSYIPAQITHG